MFFQSAENQKEVALDLSGSCVSDTGVCGSGAVATLSAYLPVWMFVLATFLARLLTNVYS